MPGLQALGSGTGLDTFLQVDRRTCHPRQERVGYTYCYSHENLGHTQGLRSLMGAVGWMPEGPGRPSRHSTRTPQRTQITQL